MILALLVPLVVSCGHDVLFVGDSALQGSLRDPGAFAGEIRTAASRADARARVVWPEAESLGEAPVEQIIRESEAEIIALSPYFALLAPELASAHPGRTFVAYYSRAEEPNVVPVRYDATEAMREAGVLLARWVFAAEDRSAYLLVNAGRRLAREEAGALQSGFEAEAGVGLEVERFEATPGREEVRSAVQRVLGDGEQAVVVLLGSASRWAFDLLRDEQVHLGLRHVRAGPEEANVLFSVYDDLATGLGRALMALEGPAPGEEVVVPSTLERSPGLVR